MAAIDDVARAWLAAEPDEDIRRQLENLIHGDIESLEAAFSGRLSFGTAGLRAPIGPGPLRMNRLVVRQAAAGFVDHLMASIDGAADLGLLIGYDARRKSRDFAFDTARVAAARGMRVVIFDSEVPTPVLAWNVEPLGVAGAVMVTASHNPPGDNGYKVYLARGAQIVSPVDRAIADKIAQVDCLDVDIAPIDSPLITLLGREMIEAYLDWVPTVRLCPDVAGCAVAYTALHGVGGDIAVEALQRSGFDRPEVVIEQHDPDPDFPSVAFPNPEEPGAMDAVVALAKRTGAALAVANDPDADRLGVAIPLRSGQWRTLSGDEIGWLLADHILSRTSGSERLVVTTLVSSSLVGEMARDHGVHFVETFTGFKWMAAAVQERPDLRLVFAYEQALGYLVAGQPLDKDGITALISMVEIASVAIRDSKTLEDRLDEIAAMYGRHVTCESSVPMSPARGAQLVRTLLESPPSQVGGHDVIEVVDYPQASLVRMMIQGASSSPVRVQVRPSGTEPKVKFYGEAIDEDPRPYLDALIEILE